MKFHEFGDPANPAILLIHGGGNAWWNYLRQARVLAQHYHVILPTLDGHGEAYDTPYISTEKSAEQLQDYLDQHCGGHVLLLGGVSLGGQIVLEMLAQRPTIAEKAIVDGCLCLPQPRLARLCMFTIRLGAPLLFSKTACRLQLAMLRQIPALRFPKEIEDYYMQDMPRLRKATLITIYNTYMAEYRAKESLRQSQAQLWIWYGSKEMKCVKQSAALIRQLVSASQIHVVPGGDHGVLAVYQPDEWLKLVLPFLENPNPF